MNPRWRDWIDRFVRRQGNRYGVKIYRIGNGGNHLHLLVLPRNRRAYLVFIRAICGLIPRRMLGAEKGDPKGIKFWDARPFSRLVTWGREYTQVAEYLLKNTLEAFGFFPYDLRSLRSWGRGIKESSA